MRTVKIISIFVGASLVMVHPAPEAGGAVFCRKRGGGVVARGTCKKRESKLDLRDFGVEGPPGPTGPQGPPGAPSFIVAFARVTANATVKSFGGNGTIEAIVSTHSLGYYQIAFTGNYADTIHPDRLTVLATAKSGDFIVTNAFVNAASATSIEVGVYCFRSGGQTPTDEEVSVAVLLGQLAP